MEVVGLGGAGCKIAKNFDKYPQPYAKSCGFLEDAVPSGRTFNLAKTGETDRFFAELYGKETGMAKGKAGSMHLSAPDSNLLGTSAVVATTIPVAVGASFVNKLKNNGKLVAVANRDSNDITVYKIIKKKRLKCIATVCTGDQPTCVSFFPNSKGFAVTSGAENTLTVYKRKCGKFIKKQIQVSHPDWYFSFFIIR